MIKNRDLIDGDPFMKLCYVVTTKQYMGRKKDLIDLESINKFLASHTLLE